MKLIGNILIAIAFILLGGILIGSVLADDRFATQANFDRGAFYEQARFARAMETQPALSAPLQIHEKVYAAKAWRGGEEYVWLFEECQNSTRWCYWGERKVSDFGSAEKGQALDVASTAIGLAVFGMAEANPLGAFALLIKTGMVYQSRSADFLDCVHARAPTAAVGYGAGFTNIISIGALLAGVAIPLPVTLGMFAANTYFASDTEQALFECAGFALAA